MADTANGGNRSERLAEIRQRHEDGWVVLSSLVFFRTIGEREMLPQMRAAAQEIADYLMSQPQYVGMARVLGGLEPENQDSVKSALAKDMIGHASAAIDGAMIVFAHSLFDSCVDALLDFSFEFSSERWASQVGRVEIKASFAELSGASLDHYRRVALKQLLGRLKTKSLQDKIRALCAACELQRGQTPVDFDDLKELNATRNAIVHGDMLGQHIPDTLKLLRQAGTTGPQLIDLVGSVP